jgi:hypothetical protein
MRPEIWGKYGWNFLHLVTFGYPEKPTEDDKQHFYDYFHALKHVLPCEKCRYNMNDHLKKFPLTEEILSSRKKLIKWGIDLHNVVNYYTGKDMLSYTEALNEINKLINPTKTSGVTFYVIFVFALIIVAYMAYYYITRQHK